MQHAELIQAVSYDPVTGAFTRRVSAGNAIEGSPIGSLSVKGYLKAMVLGEYVKLHRLALFYTYQSWPSDQVDHINGNKTDNRLVNLRVCTTTTNCTNQVGPRINNKLGLQGVHKITKTGRFRACCSIQGTKHHLGVFSTAEEAHAAYVNFKAPYLPERI